MNDLIKYKEKSVKIFEAIYIFIVAGVFGWLIETGYVYLYCGKLVDRGMCYGPICTIYGVAAIILYLCYGTPKRTRNNILYVFISSTVVLGLFELVTGLIFRYVFNVQMWNYDGQFLEILNYTSIPIALGWGFFATIYIFLLQPVLLKVIRFIPKRISERLAIILIVIYFIDYSASIFNVFDNPEVLQKLVSP